MTTATVENLNSIMEFDHVIEVHADGTVTDAPNIRELWAPELTDDVLDMAAPGWSLMTGYSGQEGYSGPVMHNSEFIGGQLARDILNTPGYYVAIVSNYLPEACDECGADPNEGDDHKEECSEDGMVGSGETTTEGWAVAFEEPQGNAG